MKTKYGSYSPTQIQSIKQSLQKSIFFLLLYVDPKTMGDYPDADVNEAFNNIQLRLNGLNSILLEPPELVKTMSYLESAWQIYAGEMDFAAYRKLILDAGAEVMKIKEVD